VFRVFEKIPPVPQFVKSIVLMATPVPEKEGASEKALSNLLLFSYYDKFLITNDLIQVFQSANL